jgi:hypothetical protein
MSAIPSYQGPAWQVLYTYETADASYGTFAAGGKPIVIASPDTPEERRRDQAARTAANTIARNRLCVTNGSRQLENGAGANPCVEHYVFDDVGHGRGEWLAL